jgi:hypothetical protein
VILYKFNEEDRLTLARLFSSPGWDLLKKEFSLRQANLKQRLIYGTDRATDADSRAGIIALDMFLAVEKEIFLPPPEPEPFRIPEPLRGDRY